MKKKTGILRFLKQRSALFWAMAVAGAAASLAGIVTVAVFTNSLNAQRTIAAYDTEGARFSSNYLLRGDSKDNVRSLFTTSTSQPVAGAVTICNYQQGRQTLPYPNAVTYTLQARLVYYDENETDKYVPATSGYITSGSLSPYIVTVSDGTTTLTLGNTTLSDSFSGAFAGGEAHSFPYNISFSANFAENQPNLYLEMIATPSTNNLPTLRGVFKPSLRAAGASDHWTGEFRDDSSTAPAGYDGYNYLITGTGSGTATVTWDPSRIVISDESLAGLLAISGAVQNGSSITFPVDSDVASRYDLQFYKVNITTETWLQMAGQVVTFSFH